MLDNTYPKSQPFHFTKYTILNDNVDLKSINRSAQQGYPQRGPPQGPISSLNALDFTALSKVGVKGDAQLDFPGNLKRTLLSSEGKVQHSCWTHNACIIMSKIFTIKAENLTV